MQFGWTYIDDFGKTHKVGIYHGNQTGHLLIHCNARVMVIDFNVFGSRSYSFFINDDLCEVNVYHEGGHFTYGFESNHKVDTPLNRTRREWAAKENRQTLIAIVIFFVVVLGIAGFVITRS